MITSIDLTRLRAVDHGWLRLRIDGSDQVVVSFDDRQERLVVPGLARSNFVEVWANERWACLIGLRAREIVVCSESGSVEIAGELARLDLGAGYDPGGLERIEFHEVDDENLLIEYEVGVALVSCTTGLVWQRVHNDVTCRLQHIEDEVAWIACEQDSFGYRIADGRLEVP